jgi:hypothetical protein
MNKPEKPDLSNKIPLRRLPDPVRFLSIRAGPCYGLSGLMHYRGCLEKKMNIFLFTVSTLLKKERILP